MAGKRIDLSGQTFGKLTVIRADGFYTTPSTGQRQALWSCQCECGQVKTIKSSRLRDGTTKSCGCMSPIFKKGHTLKRVYGPTQSEDEYYMRIKTCAKRRGYSIELTQKELVEIGRKECSYCGKFGTYKRTAEDYKNSCYAKGHIFDLEYYNSKIIELNGIDRVDNNKGYISGNCVSCCTDCNTAKMARTQEEFLTWAKRVVSHQEQKDSNIVMGSIRG